MLTIVFNKWTIRRPPCKRECVREKSPLVTSRHLRKNPHLTSGVVSPSREINKIKWILPPFCPFDPFNPWGCPLFFFFIFEMDDMERIGVDGIGGVGRIKGESRRFFFNVFNLRASVSSYALELLHYHIPMQGYLAWGGGR